MLSVVILAAGNGKRMQSSLPKVLHPLGGMPLLHHVIKTAQALKPQQIHIVYGQGGDQVQASLSDADVKWVQQLEQKGTGHALQQVLPHLPDDHRILVLYGDVPLIKPETLNELLTITQSNQVGLLVANLPNPNGFGRIIRDAQEEITAIVEHKDATAEQLAISEINTGILTVMATSLKKWLPQLKNNNAQSEYYLTDIISLAVKERIKIQSATAHNLHEVQGVNTRVELIALERQYQAKKAQEFLLQGVSILDPMRFDCRGRATLAADVVIDVNVVLEGDVTIGRGSYVAPNCCLKNVSIGENVTIKANSIIEGATVANNCTVGPFARIRPNTNLAEDVHIGNFVELKNSQVAAFSKINHLSYIGDAKVGSHVNVGAGTITCNYDGTHKHTTVIKDGAFIGSGTQLVAPVTVGEQAYIGAGSTITKEAPDGQLTLGRAKQVTVKNWKKN